MGEEASDSARVADVRERQRGGVGGKSKAVGAKPELSHSGWGKKIKSTAVSPVCLPVLLHKVTR